VYGPTHSNNVVADAYARQFTESRRTPTTPGLSRGQTERYGPTVIEARRSLRRRLPGAERVNRSELSTLPTATRECSSIGTRTDIPVSIAEDKL
jgi:hypothetical protein